MAKDFKPYCITWYYIFQECFKKAGLIEDGFFETDEWSFRLGNILAKFILEHIDNNIKFIDNAKKNFYIKQRIGAIDEKAIEERRYKNYCEYLKDAFNVVTTAVNKGGYFDELKFIKEKFEPLFLYANITDYETISDSFYNSFQNEKLVSRFVIELLKYRNKKFGKEDELCILNFEYLPPQWLSGIPAKTGFTKHKAEDNETNDDKGLNGADETGYKIVYPVKIAVVSILKPVKWFSLLPIPDEGQLIFDDGGNCEYIGSYKVTIKCSTIKDKITVFSNPRDTEPCWVKVDYLAGDSLNTIYFAEPLADTNKLKLASPEKLLTLFNKARAEILG